MDTCLHKTKSHAQHTAHLNNEQAYSNHSKRKLYRHLCGLFTIVGGSRKCTYGSDCVSQACRQARGARRLMKVAELPPRTAAVWQQVNSAVTTSRIRQTHKSEIRTLKNAEVKAEPGACAERRYACRPNARRGNSATAAGCWCTACQLSSMKI